MCHIRCKRIQHPTKMKQSEVLGEVGLPYRGTPIVEANSVTKRPDRGDERLVLHAEETC